MPTFEYDRRYVERCLELLESYLLAEEAYWPVDSQPPSGEPPYPMLTLEGLLLSRQRLLAYRGRLTDESQAAKLSLAMDTIQNHWRVAWEKKAKRAYRARLNMWRNYLEEYREQPDSQADRYPYEVRLRVFLALLERNWGKITDAGETLLALDNFLKGVLTLGNFIWGDEIQPGFPVEDYWYLYGSLPRFYHDHFFGLGISQV
jgi:hypothetical protein